MQIVEINAGEWDMSERPFAMGVVFATRLGFAAPLIGGGWWPAMELVIRTDTGERVTWWESLQ